MAVTAQTPYTSYTAAPFAVTFSTEFRVILASDLVVRVNGVTQASGYTLFGLGDSGGVDVQFDVSMTGGEFIELLRIVPLTRATDYQQLGDFLSPVVNQDFDRLWMSQQDQGFQINGALRLPFPEQAPQLPAASGRIRKLFYFDETGAPVMLGGTPGTVLGFDTEGDPVAVAPATGSATDLALALAGAGGAAQVGVNDGYSGTVYATTQAFVSHVRARLPSAINLLTLLPEAISRDIMSGTATLAHGAAINTALAANAGKTILIPGEVGWEYSLETHVRVPNNTTLIGSGWPLFRRRTGAATYLMGALDLTVGTRKNIFVTGIHFDGRRVGAVDVPARWCVYFTRTNGLTFVGNRGERAESDAFTFEFCNGLTVTHNECWDNVKPGLYFSCCDNVIEHSNVVRDSTSSVAYGIAVSSTWFSTFGPSIVTGCANGGYGFGRDSQYCTLNGGRITHLGTENESMPVGYQPYLDTVSRPGRAPADGTTNSAAHHITVNGTIIANSPADKNGANLRLSHDWKFNNVTISDHDRLGLSLQGSRRCTFNGVIMNTGKGGVDRWSVRGVPLLGVNCDGLELNGVYIGDDQAVKTAWGIGISEPLTTGVAYIDVVVDLGAGQQPIFEDGTSAPSYRRGCQFGTTAKRGQPIWRDETSGRVLATTYTNTRRNAITVNVWLAQTAASATCELLVDGTVQARSGASSSIGLEPFLTAQVPAGSTYRLNATNFTRTAWREAEEQ